MNILLQTSYYFGDLKIVKHEQPMAGSFLRPIQAHDLKMRLFPKMLKNDTGCCVIAICAPQNYTYFGSLLPLRNMNLLAIM